VKGTDVPDLSPLKDWSEVPALEPRGGLRTFVSGDLNSDLLRVRYFRRDSDGALVGKVWFGPKAEGPPGHAHGGSMAAVLDEAMGGAAWMAGHPVVAAQITTKFRQMMPLKTIVFLEAWVTKVTGRKVRTRGRLCDQNGNSFSEGEGLFIQLDPNLLENLSDDVLDVLKKIRKNGE